MFSDDEIISIREICVSDKFNKRDVKNECLLSNFNKSDLEVPRLLGSDGFYPEGESQEANFAWTEADGAFASLVSEPSFCRDLDLDAAIKNELKEAGPSSSSSYIASQHSSVDLARRTQPFNSDVVVSSTSGPPTTRPNSIKNRSACKVDKADPRSRYHFVKYLKRHGRTVKLWECGLCSREFQHQYTLMRHLPTHTDERNFHCQSCGKSFRQLSTLSQHRAIHSSERPYGCEVCTKTFNRVSTLISHRKTHSANKPYKCHICPKGFHQKGNLRNHLFTHTNERPYRCNICYKGFNQQSNLVCHKNKAHPIENTNSSDKTEPRHVSKIQPIKLIRQTKETCNVSSSVPIDLSSGPTTAWITNLDMSGPSSDWVWSDHDWPWRPMPSRSGILVDPLTTYHVNVALAQQTPFALVKSDDGTPVWLKVVDAVIPEEKQMPVSTSTNNLKGSNETLGNNDDTSRLHGAVQMENPPCAPPTNPPINCIYVGDIDNADSNTRNRIVDSADGSMQRILVPRIVTKVARNDRSERMNAVERHTPVVTMQSDIYGDRSRFREPPPLLATATLATVLPRRSYDLQGTMSSVMSPPPLLDSLPGMDLFETMDCMPLGPQIIAVGNIEPPPLADDSDIIL